MKTSIGYLLLFLVLTGCAQQSELSSEGPYASSGRIVISQSNRPIVGRANIDKGGPKFGPIVAKPSYVWDGRWVGDTTPTRVSQGSYVYAELWAENLGSSTWTGSNLGIKVNTSTDQAILGAVDVDGRFAHFGVDLFYDLPPGVYRISYQLYSFTLRAPFGPIRNVDVEVY